MLNKVIQTFTVQSYEADLAKRIKPFFIQNHVQEAGYAGSEFCGAGYGTLRAMGLSWVLNRMHLSFNGLPVWGDEVRMETWSREQTGLLWHRNFRLFRGEELLMLGTSTWTVLDLETRSLFRGQPPFDPNTHLAEDTLPYCGKLSVPKDMEMKPAGSHVPLYSEIDTNMHVNNCYYTEWAVDALPFEYLQTHELKDLQITYASEVHPDNEVSFELGRDGDVWFFRGLSGGAVSFIIRLEFR